MNRVCEDNLDPVDPHPWFVVHVIAAGDEGNFVDDPGNHHLACCSFLKGEGKCGYDYRTIEDDHLTEGAGSANIAAAYQIAPEQDEHVRTNKGHES